MAKRFEKSMQTSPSGDELAMYGRKPWYRIDKARKILGFEPSHTVDQGIDMSVRWLRHESLITHTDDKG
jgi:nucleoside-diphosphate-sugar epimerase